ISLLQGKGVDVSRIQAAFGSGDIRTAATLSDAALLALDPLPVAAAPPHAITTGQPRAALPGATLRAQNVSSLQASAARDRVTKGDGAGLAGARAASSRTALRRAPAGAVTGPAGSMHIEGLDDIPVQYEGD